MVGNVCRIAVVLLKHRFVATFLIVRHVNNCRIMFIFTYLLYTTFS